MASPFDSSKIPQNYFIVLILIVFVAFSPVLFNEFVWTWDDNIYFENPLITSLSPANLLTIFTTSPNQVYSPLTLLSLALEYHFFGLTPWIYHFNNLLLHVIIAGLLLRFGWQLGLPARAAFVSASLFALHPMHVESVAWASQRKDVLCALFYVLALSEYVGYIKATDRKKFFLSLFFGLLSMLAKPMALSLPLILLLLDWFLDRPLDWQRRIREKIWYFLYIVPLTLYSSWWLDRIQNDLGQRLLIWLYSFFFYVEKFLTPGDVSPHYELPKPVMAAHPAYIGSLCLFFVFIYTLIRWRRVRWYGFAWLYYFFSIFFLLRVHNVMEMSTANLSQVADRFMYLPSIGFCLALGALSEELFKKPFKKLFTAILIFAFFLLAAKTFLQCRIWKNDVTLWTHVIARNPQDPLAYFSRAVAYERSGENARAIEDLSKTIAVDPQYYVTGLQPSWPEEINTRLANNPYYFLARRNRGILYHKMCNNQKALEDFEEVLRINPRDAEIHERRRLITEKSAVDD